MHVLRWGTYDTGKPRTRILSAGMRAAGVELNEIHALVWEGIDDKSQVRRFGVRVRLSATWLRAYPGLIWRLLRARRPDVILVGYPGILDIFIAAFIGRLRCVPVVWDMFLSLYDTIVEDRQLLKPGSLRARLLRWLEHRAVRCANLVFLDTQTHARRIESLFALPAGHCGAVWVGVETEHFAPTGGLPAGVGGRALRVLFYGQFIPLHGIGTIVESMRLLRDAPVEWMLIGRGQDASRIRAMIDADAVPRVRWTDWVKYDELHGWISDADLCLGIFGGSEKAASVIPNKVFQILAAGKPLVTRDSPAIRELLEPRAFCTYLVPAENAEALAAAVRTHLKSRSARRSQPCHSDVAARIDAAAIGRQFLTVVHQRLGIS